MDLEDLQISTYENRKTALSVASTVGSSKGRSPIHVLLYQDPQLQSEIHRGTPGFRGGNLVWATFHELRAGAWDRPLLCAKRCLEMEAGTWNLPLMCHARLELQLGPRGLLLHRDAEVQDQVTVA